MSGLAQVEPAGHAAAHSLTGQRLRIFQPRPVEFDATRGQGAVRLQAELTARLQCFPGSLLDQQPRSTLCVVQSRAQVQRRTGQQSLRVELADGLAGQSLQPQLGLHGSGFESGGAKVTLKIEYRAKIRRGTLEARLDCCSAAPVGMQTLQPGHAQATVTGPAAAGQPRLSLGIQVAALHAH